MRWLENSYDAFLDFTAHHWWTIVVPSLGLLALTGWMLVERPKAFIPTEDQGYLIVVDPDARRHRPARPTARVAQQRRARSPRSSRASATCVLLDGFNVINATNQTNCGDGVRDPRGVVEAHDARAAGRRRWPAKLQAQISERGPRRRGRWSSSRRRSAA